MSFKYCIDILLKSRNFCNGVDSDAVYEMLSFKSILCGISSNFRLISFVQAEHLQINKQTQRMKQEYKTHKNFYLGTANSTNQIWSINSHKVVNPKNVNLNDIFFLLPAYLN